MLRFPGFLRFRPGSRRRSRLTGMPGCVQLLEQRVLPAFNLVIGTGLTSGVTESTPGHFEASASGAFLSVADIQNRMAAGHDVSITSGENGQEAGSITWNAGAELDFNGTGTRQLTIRSHDSSQTGSVLFAGRVRDSVPGDDDLSVTLIATRGLTIESGASITTADGGILLRGNAGIRRQAGSFHGVLVRGSLTTTGSGEIIIEGRSGLSRNSGRQGVLLSYASVSSSGSGDIRISGMADQMPIRIQASQLISSGTGDVALSGDDIAISSNSTIDVGDNAASFAPLTSGVSIVLGGTSETVDNLDLQAGELNRITAGLVRVGHLSDAGSAEMGIRTWDITIPRAYAAPAGWNTLSLIGRGLIRETRQGALTVANLAAVGFMGVHLPAATNAISQIAGQTNGLNFSVVNAATTTINVGTVDGLSGIASRGGDIFIQATQGIVVDQAIDSGPLTGGVLSVGGNVTQNVVPTVGDGDVRLNSGAMPVAGTDRLMFPLAFTTRTFLIDPQNNFFDNTITYNDTISNMQLVQLFINNPNPLTTNVLLRHDLGIGYQFDDNGANVFEFSLSGHLAPFVFPTDTQAINTVRLAGVLTEQLRTPLPDGNAATYTVTRTPGSNVVTPVNVSTTQGQLLVNFLEWTSFRASTTRLNPQFFAIPPAAPGVGLLPVGTLLGNAPSTFPFIFAPLPIDTVRVGSPARVQAVLNVPLSGTFDVLLSRDGGQTYSITIATGLDASRGGPNNFPGPGAASHLGYTFTPTAAMRTSTARLRIVVHRADDGSTTTIDSFESFEIL